MNKLRIPAGKLLLVVSVLLAPGRLAAQLNIPLTVQESNYGGFAGVARTSDPFSVGIPLPDSAGVRCSPASDGSLFDNNCNTLTLVKDPGTTGQTPAAAQFRCLAIWPDGNCKWVEVDSQASLGTGGAIITPYDLVNSGGTGNFGGSNLATDNGATITVNTGAAIYTIKKANFNVFDKVVIGGTTFIDNSVRASQGLVVMGPDPTLAFPSNTQCATQSACTTVYASANDPNSTAVIEENGPVKAVIKATGYHLNGASSYMGFSVRMYFYVGKPYAKIQVELKNADNTPNGSIASVFNSANKGFTSYELRLALNPAMTGFSFGGPSSVISGTYTASEDAYLYSGYTNKFQPLGGGDDSYDSPSWVSPVPRQACVAANGGSGWCYPDDTQSQEGYKVLQGSNTLSSGNRSQYPIGWGDVFNGSSGVGVMLGVYQMAAYWPKSIEFDAGGTNLVIGIWPKQNAAPYYQAWPQHSIHDLFLWPHTSSLSSPGNSFLGLQHNLLARAPYTAYNSANVFPFQTLGKTNQQNYYNTLTSTIGGNAVITPTMVCCLQDLGVGPLNIDTELDVPRFYYWRGGGGDNQSDIRWADLLQWIEWGYPGRFTYAQWFYRYMQESGMPRSDGFNWSSHPFNPDRGFDYSGDPAIQSANSSQVTLPQLRWCTVDLIHCHAYGIMDYYYISGDESARDFLLEFPKTDWTDPNVPNNIGYISIARGVGIWLMWAARLHDFLAGTADPAAPNVFTTIDTMIADQIYPTLVTPSTSYLSYGTDPNRGVFWGCTNGPLGSPPSPCPAPIAWPDPPATNGPTGAGSARYGSTFLTSILIQGEYEYARSHGQSWPDYWKLMDLAYGNAQWVLNEMKVDTGSWPTSRIRYYIGLDQPNTAAAPNSGFPDCNGTLGVDAGEGYPNPPFPDCTPENNQYSPETIWMPFFITGLLTGDLSWSNFFGEMLQRNFASSGGYWEFDEYASPFLNGTIYEVQNPGNRLQDLSFSVTETPAGSGSYQLNWTVPAGAQFYRVKWSNRIIVPSLNFDPLVTNAFGIDPTTHQPWFSATNATGIPTPGTPGSQQQMTVTTGITGLTAQNFSVKAFAPLSVGTQANLVKASGDNPVQSGAVGAVLANAFTVEVSDANNNPVSGVSVSFTVSGGGGSLVGGSGSPSSVQATTNALGEAYATLILGTTAGTDTVTVTSAGLTPVTFTATATATPTTGVATTMTKVSGDNPVQSATAGSQLPNPFIVLLTDSNNNPVSGVSVSFTVSGSGGSLVGGSGSPSTVVVTTGSNGQASATLTLGTVAGTNTVTVTSAGLAQVIFTASGTASGTAPGGSTPLPAGNWVTTSTDGYPAQSVGWEHLIWVPNIHKAVMLGGYHAPGSEPNTGLLAYDFTANRWDVLDVLTPFHNEHHPENGHPDSINGYNPATGMIVSNCCYSGSSAADTTEYVWLFDPIGQVGRNFQTTAMPVYFANGYGTFDQSTNLLIALDPNGSGAWVYNSTTNRWSNPPQTGTPPAGPCLQMGAADYDSANHLTYWFGGYSGAGYCGNLYTYNSTTNVWTQLNPSCPSGCPPARAFNAFAYDSIHNIFLLFGGTNNLSVTAFSDTWVLDPTGNGGQGTWTQLSPSTSPTLNLSANVPSYRMVFDPDDNAFILAMPSAGETFYNGGTWTGYPTETWFFRYSGTGPNIGNTPNSSFAATAGSLNNNPGSAQSAGNVWNGGWSMEPATVTDGTNAYMAWEELGLPFDSSNSGLPHIFVKQLPNTFLGGSYNSISIDGGGAEKPSLALVNGTLWESHSEYFVASTALSYLVAKSWNGSSWSGGRIPMMTSADYSGTVNTNNTSVTWVSGSNFLGACGGSGGFCGLAITISNAIYTVTSCADATHCTLASNAGVQTGVPWKWCPCEYGVSQLLGIGSTPYLALVEEDRTNTPWEFDLWVTSYNGTVWAPLGSRLNRLTNLSPQVTKAQEISITTDGTNPIVAWSELTVAGGIGPSGVVATPSQIFVSQWNGSTWIPLGGSLNQNPANWANSPSITYLNGSPYVCWTERPLTGLNQLYCAGWSGSSWVLVGSGSLNKDRTNGWSFAPSLINDGANLYVGWVEHDAGTRATVYVSEFAGGNWTALGSTLNGDPTLGSAQHMSLSLLDGQPLATWGEVNYGSTQQVFAKQWNDSSWTLLAGNDALNTIAIISGNNQTAMVGSVLPQQLVIQLKGTSGVPLANTPIRFTVTSGGGSLTSAPTQTDSSGEASVTWTLGAIPGLERVAVTSANTITNSFIANANSGAAAPATHLAISGPSTVTAGTAFTFNLTALDQFNNTAAGYTGTVRFTSSDAAAVLPTSSTLVNGTGGFLATLKTAGFQTITATDTVTPSITGTSGNISVNPAPAATMIKLSGDNPVQSSPIGTQLSNPFVVKVTDSLGNPVSGVTVTFQVSLGGGRLLGGSGSPSTLPVTTNTSGVASVTLILGSSVGANSNAVTASASGLTNSPLTFTATGIAALPSTIVKVSGDNPVQSAPVGTQLSNPFVVEVTDNFNNPVSGLMVTFQVNLGGGTLVGGSGNPSTLLVTTNASGQASATLIVGPSGGTDNNTVTASASGLVNSPLTFTATGTATVATSGNTIVKVSGDNQSGTVETELANAFAVEVTDANNNPVSGVTVTFAVDQGGGTLIGGSGSPSTVQSTTNGLGQAYATLILGPTAGTDTVTASGSGLTNSPMTFTSTAADSTSPPPPPPVISLGATSASFVTTAGSNPPTQQVTIANSGGGTLNWSVTIPSNTGNWLAISPTSGVGNGSILLSVNTSGLAPGSYSATVTVQASGAASQSLSVSLTVNPAPTIVLSSSSLNFVGSPGSNPNPQQLTISSSGSALSWSAAAATSSGGSWLILSATSGSTPATLTISVNAASLAANTYQGTISISAPGNNPQTVIVTLTLGQPVISLDASFLSFSAQTGGANPPPHTFRVQNSGAGTLLWTATVDTLPAGSWLSVSPSSGTAPSKVTVSVNTAGLATGTYQGAISISAQPGLNVINSPQVVFVNLSVGSSTASRRRPRIGNAGIVSGATFTTGISPGSLTSLFGTDMASTTATASLSPLASSLAVNNSAGSGGFSLPTILANTQVLVNGTPAPLLYVSPDQINFEMPVDVSVPSVQIVVASDDVPSDSESVQIAPEAPAIFTNPPGGSGQGIILNQDFSLNSAANPAAPGSIIMIYATGLGPVTPAVSSGQPGGTSPLSTTVNTPVVLIDNLPAKVLFSGLAPGFVGLYQVNVQIPPITNSSSACSLQIQLGGQSSNIVTLAVTATAATDAAGGSTSAPAPASPATSSREDL